jgi:soluble P-type ATPase
MAKKDDQKYFNIKIPGKKDILIKEIFFDFTGTLSKDGRLIEGVSEKLILISQKVKVSIYTADTFGTAKKQLENLPVEINLIENGNDKEKALKKKGAKNIAAVGNGENDIKMLKNAGLSIMVIGPEGAAAKLFKYSDIVVNNILDALDLFLNNKRIIATLRK